MKPTQKKDLSEYRQTASRLRALLGNGMLAEGSLCRTMAGGRMRWQLTKKVNGKTATLYVPDCDAAELKAAVERWRQAKALMKSLGVQSWKILRSGMAKSTRSSTGKSDATRP